MNYIDAEKLIAEIENIRREFYYKGEQNLLHDAEIIRRSVISSCNDFLFLIDSLQQEQPDDNLTNIAYWLEHFGMPKENIENCITQISQGYGAIRYLEGVQHGAEAVNELAQQEQPEVDLEKEITNYYKRIKGNSLEDAFCTIARHFYELGFKARKEE